MRWIRSLLVVGFALLPLAAAGFALWSAAYPGPHDPKCPRYVLWKWGLWPFDEDVVYGSMIGDPDSEEVVEGLTLEQLRRRFGRVRSREDCTAYQRYCGRREYLDREIHWLGDSPWLVVLHHGRVERLCLMKG